MTSYNPLVIDFPDVPDGEDVRISASTYVSFKQCPERANAHLQGIYGPESRPAFLGSLAHRIFSRHLTSGPIASEEFVQACREEIGGSNLNMKMAALEMKPSDLAAAIEEVRGLYERFTRLPGEGFEGSEVALETEPSPGVQLVGTVDAVYAEELGGHRLVDWKTGELGAPEDQLMFYALLWALDRDDLPAFVEAVSVRTGERYRTVPSQDDLSTVAADLAGMVGVLRLAWARRDDLDRHGGPWCSYCPLLSSCAEGQSAEAILSQSSG